MESTRRDHQQESELMLMHVLDKQQKARAAAEVESNLRRAHPHGHRRLTATAAPGSALDLGSFRLGISGVIWIHVNPFHFVTEAPTSVFPINRYFI